ncbi:MAG: winged helix-turn-helix transcriptional regulator [Thermoleophilaceae bacterium]|nr:winged helix-turn-helix transcriptional regulator [Thermoleophilaceae bacterium]
MEDRPPISLAASPEDFITQFGQPEQAIKIAGLEIRPDSREVLTATGRIQMTGREFEILRVLVEHADRVVTRETIYAEVWGGHMPNRDRAADVYVRRVREKLRTLSPEFTYIHTHFGFGYRFWPDLANKS